MRIPWGVLGFYDPSFRQVYEYISNKKKISGLTISGVNITFVHVNFGSIKVYASKLHTFHLNALDSTAKYSWPQWGTFQDISRGWHFREKNGLFSAVQSMLEEVKNSNWRPCDRAANSTCQLTAGLNCTFWAYGPPKFKCGVNCLIGVIGAVGVLAILVTSSVLVFLKRKLRSKFSVIHREENYVSTNFDAKAMLAKREQRIVKKDFFTK